MGNCQLLCYYQNKVEITINKNISLNKNSFNLKNNSNENTNEKDINTEKVMSARYKTPRLKDRESSLIYYESYKNKEILNPPILFENNPNENDLRDYTEIDHLSKNYEKNYNSASILEENKEKSNSFQVNEKFSKKYLTYEKKSEEKRGENISENSGINFLKSNINQFLTDQERSFLWDKITKINLIKKIQKSYNRYLMKKINQTDLLGEPKINLTLAFKKFKTILYNDGSKYKGQSQENKRNGIGIIYDKNYTFIGKFINDRSIGIGKMETKMGFSYFGYWTDFKLNGIGKFLNNINGTLYEGNFFDTQQNGYGIEKWISNSFFEGEYKDDIKAGIGILTFNDDSFYCGEFEEDDMNGIGKYTYVDGSSYVGEWRNNKMNGCGIYSWVDGRIFEGEFVDDMKHGFGIMKNKKNNIYFGIWNNDLLEGEGCILENNTIKKYFFAKSKKIKLLPQNYVLTFENIVEKFVQNKEELQSKF